MNMAKKGKNCLVVDQDDLSGAKEVYDNAADTMSEITQELDEAVAQLRKNWVSTGSDEFFSQFDNVWHENMELYGQVLKHMSDCLTGANGKYEEVFEAARKLHI